MKYYYIKQRSDEWNDLRKGKFTSSNNKNLFSKKNSVAYNNTILRVVFERITNKIADDEIFVNRYMQNGIDQEPLAIREYEMQTFNSVKPIGFIKYNSFIGGSPDGLVNDDGLIEVKCPKYSTHIKYLLENKLPDEYKIQCYSNLFISKRKWLDFISYHPDLKPFIIRIYPDKEIFSEIETELNLAVKTAKNLIRRLKRRNAVITFKQVA